MTASLALATGQRTEAVKPPGNRRDEPAFAANVGRDRPEQGRRSLICAVGAAKPLDGGIRPPARLQKEMDAPCLVPDGKVSMVAAPRAAGIGKDQDALAAIHEGLGLGDVGARTARLELLPTITSNDKAPAAAGHFGDRIDPEALNDRIERSCYRR